MAHVNISIEDDLIKKAKGEMLNISEVAEKALREKLGKINVEIDEGRKCHECSNPGECQTAKMVRNKPVPPSSLTWLYPNEIWICERCLKIKVNSVKKGKNYGI